MDTLSDVLSLLRPRNFMFRGLDAGEAWSLQFPAAEGIRCYAVISGECWLAIDAADVNPVRLTSGDCVLLTRKQSFRMGSDLTLPPRDGLKVLSEAREGGIATLANGGNFTGVGGYFKFADKHASVLLGLLPPIVHLHSLSERAALRASMELMMQELREPQPGGSLVAQHLAHLMLVLALRVHLAAGNGTVGWLFALADKQMAAAINAMHDDPAQPWTLQSLAQRARMSRSTFAQKFKDSVGTSPMEYLARWRMLLAGEKLTSSSESIASIAVSLGYESESAFRTAFKRVMGCSPRQYAQPNNRGVTRESVTTTLTPHSNPLSLGSSATG